MHAAWRGPGLTPASPRPARTTSDDNSHSPLRGASMPHSDMTPLSGRPLDWLLENLVGRVPGARSAVLASSDGVRKFCHGLGNDDADRLAALATGLFSLGRIVGELSHSQGGVQQVVVEHEAGLLFVSAAGSGAVLGVLASPQADPGAVGFAMTQLVREVPSHLATPARPGVSATRTPTP
ncbi:roadblock/LC7 domain-containing protein [Streptomyces sp. NPDC005706]|uniref:roadblock/LC7 domain-containing protein n=1 Tax=Streptomyces sp. NPDC005706 TaxID=3157169 RepID=UPI00340C8137